MPRFIVPDINSGVIPVTRGGTDATSAGAARSNLGAVGIDLMGVAGGIATLGPDGKLNVPVPASQIEASGGGSGPGSVVVLDSNGTIPSSMLPKASSGALGGIRIGSGLNIDGNGVVSATGGGGGGGSIIVNDDDATNSELYPLFGAITSGSLTDANVSSTKLTYNPFQGRITATEFNSTSDIRFKKDLSEITGALAKLQWMKGYTFTFTETDQRSAGVIAQELQIALPEAVAGTEDRLTVNYNAVIGLLVAAVNELRAEVQSLKAQG